MEKELFKSSWLNWVPSHFSWEISKIKTFRINRQIIVVTDYQTWAARLITVTLINTKVKKRGWEYLKTWVEMFPGGNFPGEIYREEAWLVVSFLVEFSWYRRNCPSIFLFRDKKFISYEVSFFSEYMKIF